MNQLFNKKLLLGIFLLLNLFSQAQRDNLCLHLIASFDNYKNLKDSVSAIKYINDFPNDFFSYYSLFNRETGCINDSYHYLELLEKAFEDSKSRDSIIFDKIYRISLNGKNEVDGVSVLQRLNFRYFKNKIEFVCFLENKSKDELASYLLFLFDVLPTSLIYEQINYEKYKDCCPKTYSMIKELELQHIKKRKKAIYSN